MARRYDLIDPNPLFAANALQLSLLLAILYLQSCPSSSFGMSELVLGAKSAFAFSWGSG